MSKTAPIVIEFVNDVANLVVIWCVIVVLCLFVIGLVLGMVWAEHRRNKR